MLKGFKGITYVKIDSLVLIFSGIKGDIRNILISVGSEYKGDWWKLSYR